MDRFPVEKKGFTLVENVVAIVLLGIVITATIFSIVTARMYVTVARHHYQAINIARETVETILAQGLPTSGDVVIDPISGLEGIVTVSNPTPYTIDITVSWTEKLWSELTMLETIVVELP